MFMDSVYVCDICEYRTMNFIVPTQREISQALPFRRLWYFSFFTFSRQFGPSGRLVTIFFSPCCGCPVLAAITAPAVRHTATTVYWVRLVLSCCNATHRGQRPVVFELQRSSVVLQRNPPHTTCVRSTSRRLQSIPLFLSTTQ